uniref:Uncharacterized protein n=1 Tax=Strigamia maritima TaxID=126957 RepID=T1IL13_STRMM
MVRRCLAAVQNVYHPPSLMDALQAVSIAGDLLSKRWPWFRSDPMIKMEPTDPCSPSLQGRDRVDAITVDCYNMSFYGFLKQRAVNPHKVGVCICLKNDEKLPHTQHFGIDLMISKCPSIDGV